MRSLPILALCLILLSCRQEESAKPANGAPQDSAKVATDSGKPNTPASDASTETRTEHCKIPLGVLKYARAMKDWEAHSGPASMEPLWKLAVAAQDTLAGCIETMTDSDYAQAETLMVGHFLSRDDIVLVEPYADSFVNFADRKGLPEDKAFFGFLKNHRSEYRSRHWSWDLQIGDNEWCMRMGSAAIVDDYFAAESLLKAFPGKYDWWIQPELRELENSTLAGDVCESRKAALDGLAHSIARLPKDHPLRKTLEATLAHLTQDKGKITFGAEKMGIGE